MSKDGWLPPGVEVGDLPGNHLADIAFEEYLEAQLENLAHDWIEQELDFIKLWVFQSLTDDPAEIYSHWTEFSALFWDYVQRQWDDANERKEN